MSVLEGLSRPSYRFDPFTVSVIRDPDGFTRLCGPWNSLFAQCPNAHAPLRWEWMHRWWEVYGAECAGAHGGIEIVVWEHEGTLVAIAPWYVSHRRRWMPRCLAFLSTGEAPGDETYAEYLDVLVLDEYRDAVGATIPKIITEVCRVDHVQYGLGTELSLLRSACRALPVLRNREQSHTGWIADLSGGFDQYLARLSKRTREHCRKLLRQSERLGVTLVYPKNSAETAQAFDDLVTLHQQRWERAGERGAFASPEMRAFHRAIVSEQALTGELILASLREGELTRAVVYGFVAHRRFEYYQMGVSAETEVSSLGILMHLLLMRELAERSIELYDLLVGDAEYKRRLGTASYILTCGSAACMTPGGVLAITLEGAQGVFQRVARLIP